MGCLRASERLENPLRRHSALGYRSPISHEEVLTDPSPAG
ncbi:hypothetical protein OPKNFCMD_0505 [Methylobacterium crusticola]|uniref:Integrase catalytic domain-containing protein n=1 Tax=Methylobacterium crusticola TaxID=1697972 RepID=A0ABQ4QSW1_9HYPH|nr:hypothetical protein OPKNFCMD_0505 [Methylobacterium crusticola]